MRRRLLLLGGFATAAVAAPTVGPALDRPAVAARAPERAVLLAGARAGTRLVLVGERGLVLASDDHGRSWQQQPCPTSVTLTAVRFADDRHGVAVGHGATVLTTSDSGRTWQRRLDGRQAATLALEAARASGDAAALKSAERLQADGPDKPLLDVLLLDAQRIWVVGAYGLALASDDGGQRFASVSARLPNPKELHLYAARAQGDTLLLAGEQGLILRSIDGGQRFTRLDVPYKGSFFTAELGAGGSITLAGLRGNAWRSNDGGLTWAQLPCPVPAAITASLPLADGRVLWASQAGLVLAEADGALRPLPAPPQPPINALVQAASGQVLALGVMGVMPLALKA